MRSFLIIAGVYGALAIGLGAFAAHGFVGFAGDLGYTAEEAAKRLDNLQTGARYQLSTAAALLAIGLAAPGGRYWTAAGGLLTGGAAVFSGCLYALSVAGEEWRWLGAVVPIGGAGLIAGWVAIAVAALATGRRSPAGDGPSLSEEVVRLEEVITHQQHLVNELNEVLTATRDDLDAAARRVKTIEPVVRRLADAEQGAEDLPDERPPHY
ncbi:SlyX family protein [Botrimarina sp.]|uniref:SlyX family protein n=1 Tax=Botrimarina sp. TaxID=2795802 RepID=UPI0032EFC48B